MADSEQFAGFKQKLVDDNEKKYGKEIRERFGDDAVDSSNMRIKGMREEQWRQAESLGAEINETLKAALASGDPAGEIAQKACDNGAFLLSSLLQQSFSVA